MSSPESGSAENHDYDFVGLEPKWQARWEAEKAFRTPDDPAELKAKPKYYILDMFPYPSGAGLHVGHPEGYTATDILARLKRMQGFNVLHPMGWDAFGLPAERAAERENLHPSVITKRNVDNFRRQIKRLGFSYDWEREVDTSDPDYYRWTQWIFLKLYEKNLAYLAEVPVNWCPALGTVLANEEVKDGVYVETGDPVERRTMTQWMLRITAYAERLLEDLDGLDWPDGIKEMQRNWIGKSEGAEVRFEVEGVPEGFTVFTTRPDTLFGCTYCVLAPEHPLVSRLATPEARGAVDAYVREARGKSDLARTELAKEKTGVFTGAMAKNPATGKLVPVWIADYVLTGYGTGAIMAVPAHDARDWDFAKRFDLPVLPVVKPVSGEAPEGKAFEEEGVAFHSGLLDGMPTAKAKEAMGAWLEEMGCGKRRVQYRLRDWLFSRQRYWGEPFPIIHLADKSMAALPVDSLPITLPMIDEYKPTADGRPPLARAPEAWSARKLPDGRRGVMETNTMPQWAGSCWYYLRYIDPRNARAPYSAEAENYWMPVDLYVGGVEHAVLHLLYARFWHKVLFDCGLVHTREPFQKLFNQGMILAHSYRDGRGKYLHPHECEERDGKWVSSKSGEAVERQIEKMSKSRYNVVNPDDVIARYGADSMRLYEMFMGPLEQVKPWQMDGVEGVHRFLARVWRLVVDQKSGGLHPKVAPAGAETEPELRKLLHKTVKKVGEDTVGMRFNTAISQMMVFVNEATAAKTLPREILEGFLKVLSPYAPHLAEELWERLGHPALLCRESWPSFDPALCADDRTTIVVQVNGKVRGRFEAAKGLSQGEVLLLAKADPGVAPWIEGKKIMKEISVPGKLVNLVVAP